MTIYSTINPYPLKQLTFEENKAAIKDFLTKNKSYLIWQDGKEIDDELVKDFFFGELPNGNTYDDKYIIGAFENDALICVFDILKNYPRKNTWVIGLMLLDEQIRRQGTGQLLFNLMENNISENGAAILRLGVLEDNFAGKAFWVKLGFTETGEVKRHADGRAVFVMEKQNR